MLSYGNMNWHGWLLPKLGHCATSNKKNVG